MDIKKLLDDLRNQIDRLQWDDDIATEKMRAKLLDVWSSYYKLREALTK